MTYDEVIKRAVAAADEAADAAGAFDRIGDEHPQFSSFTSYYRDRASMFAQVAQAWSAIANAITTRGREQLEAGL